MKFAELTLGLTMWDRLEEMLQAIQDHDRVAIRAGRKVSKTGAAVAAAIWWAGQGGKVMVTAPSELTLKDPFWVELGNRNRASELGLSVPERPSTSTKFPGGGTITGRVAAKAENLQGPSGVNSLYIIDEASGMKRDIVEAIEGNTAGGGKIVMLGNPTQLAGPFYDAFNDPRSHWHTIHISSRESPNVRTGRVVIPGLAIPEWIKQVEEEHGPESPFVAIHVDGKFPRSGANNVIPLDLVEAAIERWDETEPVGELAIGLDVARSGDDESVMQPVRGKKALQPIAWRNQTGPSLGARVLRRAEQLRIGDETVRINVDVIGVGASAFDWLKDNAPDWVIVNAVNVAERATSERYRLLRDQLSFAVKDWLEDGGAIPRVDELKADLIAATYSFDERGRYRVASKDELKALLKRSPDYGDALGLAVYQPPEPFTPAPPMGWDA